MRILSALAVIALLTACQRTPEQQQADTLRRAAHDRAAAISNHADAEADRLEAQGAGLDNRAKQAGGFSGERLKVQADALRKEAGIVRKQARMQSEAIEESTDAQIKATSSR
jgi:hypothetical protein